MSWVRIDDQATLNRKFLKAGPAASWLWVCGLAHCQAKLTDGFIADELLPMIGVKQGYARLAKWLVNAGLWERVEDGYMVHDYHDFNQTRAEVLAKRAADSTRKSRGFQSDSKRKDSTRTPDAPSHPIPSTLPKEPEVSVAPRRTPIVNQRAHQTHALCGVVCMPRDIWAEFVGRVQGDEARISAFFRKHNDIWQERVDAGLVIGDDAFTFWRARFVEEFGTTKTSIAPVASRSEQQLDVMRRSTEGFVNRG